MQEKKVQAVDVELQNKIAQTDLYIADNALKLQQILLTVADTKLKHQQIALAPWQLGTGLMATGAGLLAAGAALAKFFFT